MKIDPHRQADLLQRMQQANESGRATSAGPAAGGQAKGPPATTGATGAGEAAVIEPTRTPLERRLEETAAAALDGAFDSDQAVRAAVVDAIVEERYGARLAPERRERMVATLTEALVDDPVFKGQVDDMLILAASELARRR